MRVNPLSDTLAFLMQHWWPIYVFWVLLLASIAIALANLVRTSEQRTGRHVWMWVTRLIIGSLWWQQTLWKLPPTYTDHPDGISGGLHFWVGEMVQHAAFGGQSWFVEHVVQPNFYVFALQVYLIEVIIAISLMLGIFSRMGSVLGALMATNLFLGLYRADYEWPWSYALLILLHGTFAVYAAGRSLGFDVVLRRSANVGFRSQGGLAQLVKWLT
jgi:uncharacterized membrane protein YphA (DoxX/SURF4 family)